MIKYSKIWYISRIAKYKPELARGSKLANWHLDKLKELLIQLKKGNENYEQSMGIRQRER